MFTHFVSYHYLNEEGRYVTGVESYYTEYCDKKKQVLSW